MTAARKLWPFPGDSPIARARKVGLAYRALAKEQEQIIAGLTDAIEKVKKGSLDPALLEAPKPPNGTVADLDQRFVEWGETWHCDVQRTFGPDDMVKAGDAAALIQVSVGTLGRARIRGVIKGVWNKTEHGYPGHYTYKVSDVYKLSTELRGRGWRAGDRTDTVTVDGGSDSE